MMLIFDSAQGYSRGIYDWSSGLLESGVDPKEGYRRIRMRRKRRDEEIQIILQAVMPVIASGDTETKDIIV